MVDCSVGNVFLVSWGRFQTDISPDQVYNVTVSLTC